MIFFIVYYMTSKQMLSPICYHWKRVPAMESQQHNHNCEALFSTSNMIGIIGTMIGATEVNGLFVAVGFLMMSAWG